MGSDYYELENEYGYAILKKGNEYEDSQRIVFLETLFINKEFQNSGHGSNLLELVLDDAYDFGYNRVIVHARPLEDDRMQSRLIKFYENNNFRKSKQYTSLIGQYMEIDL